MGAKYLSESDAQAFLGVTSDYLRWLVRTEQLPAERNSEGQLQFLAVDVRDLAETYRRVRERKRTHDVEHTSE